MHLRLLTYNILQGGLGREALLCEVIEAVQPDVVLLQELNDPIFLEELAGRLNMHFFFAQANRHLLWQNWRLQFGRRNIGLLSRLPIKQASSYHPFVIRRTLLEATLEYEPGQLLNIYGVHLVASLTIADEWWRSRELKAILARVARRTVIPYLMAGDFNTVRPGDPVLTEEFPRYLRLKLALQGGQIYRLALPILTKAGLVDCYRQLHPAEPGFTLPAPRPNTRLDYIFATLDLASKLRRCEVVIEPPAVHSASDHYPVVADFELD